MVRYYVCPSLYGSGTGGVAKKLVQMFYALQMFHGTWNAIEFISRGFF